VLWRNTLFLTVFLGLLGSKTAPASVTYSFAELYSYQNPANFLDNLALSAGFDITLPGFLTGNNSFATNQLTDCGISGFVDGAPYGSPCTGVSIDVSGTTISVDVMSSLASAGGIFTVSPGQFGTWSVFEPPATFPAGTTGNSSLTINFAPEPATAILSGLALLPLLARGLRRYSRTVR